MARACKCDRCGQFYEVNEKCPSEKIRVSQGKFYDGAGFYRDREWNFDLCGSCFHLLARFLNTSFTEGGLDV